MKKVTCFIESLAGGGAEHQMAILCNLLHEKGYEVSLVTYADVPDHYTIDDSIERIKLGSGKSSLRAYFRTLWYFLRVKTDCVISYRHSGNIRVIIPLFLRRYIKLICGERNLSSKDSLNRFEKFLFSFGYNRADYIVPNSQSQCRFLIEKCPKWKSKITTIINYTDLKQFKESLLPSDNTPIKIAVFARYSPQKNTPRFIEMLAKLKQQTQKPFHIDWYGNRGVNGNDSSYIMAKQLVTDYNVGDVISLLPPLHNPAEVMDRYHALCLPSLYEGFSNSVAEGICSSKPMLVSNVSDNGVMVQDGENGFLFDPKSVDSMQEAFLKFFNTSVEQRKKMAQKSRQIAEKLFDADVFIQSYIELIES